MRPNFSHENYRDDEPNAAGSDRAFGCTVGAILMAIGAAKAFAAGAIPIFSYVSFAAGAVLLLLGVVAPSRLSILNRTWSKIGGVIARAVNPIVLAILFFIVVTPMAFVMRIAGKRPLRLAPDRTGDSYWIRCEPPQNRASSMRRQY